MLILIGIFVYLALIFYKIYLFIAFVKWGYDLWKLLVHGGDFR